MNRIRMGVVGCGAIAQIQHLPHLSELRDKYELVGLCDVSRQLVDFMGDLYQVSHRVTDYRELLALDLDAVLLCFADPKTEVAVAESPHAMARRERTMALLLLLALTVWMTDFLHHISPAWVALGVAGVMIMPFVGIVSPLDMEEKVKFGSLFYLAGVLGLGALVAHGGVGDFLAQTVIPLIRLSPGQDAWNFAAIAGLSSLLAMFVTQPGSPAILTPLASSMAEAATLPVETVLMLTGVGYTTVILPYQTPPLVIAMQLGGVPMGKGNKLCLFLLAVTVLILVPLDYLWWRLLGWLP